MGSLPGVPYASLYVFFGGPGLSIRPLTPIEIWRTWGLSARDWEACGGERDLDFKALHTAMRSLPEGHARCFVTAAVRLWAAVKRGARFAGMCVFEEEVTLTA